MIAEREIVDIKSVEEKPLAAASVAQPERHSKLFIASDICLLAGLVVMAIALMLPVAALSTVLITFPMSVTFSLSLLIVEVSLFVVGAILFAWGFVWPRIK
jgi:type IV secretory pathway component VirB8